MIPITGVEAANDFYNNGMDLNSPVWPEKTQSLYQDYARRYPDLAFYTPTMAAWIIVKMWVKAMQEAGTTDSEAVLAVIDNPDFTFEYFGFPEEVRFGGKECYGIDRILPMRNPYGVYGDGEFVQLGYEWAMSP